MTTDFVLLFLLVVANGLFSGAEIALLTIRKTRLQELEKSGHAFAGAVARLRKQPERFLATVQIGITVVGATAAAFGGASIATRIEPSLRALPVVGPYAHELALASIIGLVSYLSLVVGELVPKSLALRYPEPYAKLTARLLEGMAQVARPAVWVLTASSNVILRGFGDHTSFSETRLSADELHQLVEEATEAGSLDRRSGDIAARAIDFGGLHARDVMVPRHAVTAMPIEAEPEKLRRLLVETGYARLPVYDGSDDNVVGYVATREALAKFADGEPVSLPALVRPAYFVPETMRAVDLLHELQKRRLHLAMVVDELGGFSGIVTVEDLVEELVGELFDEHDFTVTPVIERQLDGSYLVAATTPLRDFNRESDLELPEGDWATVGGLSLALAGGIPKVGDRLEVAGGTLIEVVDATPRRVRTVRIIPASKSKPTG